MIGANFEILTARHVSGVFAKVNGTVINSSEHFTVTYNSDNVTLTMVSGGWFWPARGLRTWPIAAKRHNKKGRDSGRGLICIK